MVTPPSALARNVSGSNLALDFFATAESSCAPASRIALSPTAPRRQACLRMERSRRIARMGPLRKRRFNKAFGAPDEIRRLEVRLRLWTDGLCPAEIAASFCRKHGASVGQRTDGTSGPIQIMAWRCCLAATALYAP